MSLYPTMSRGRLDARFQSTSGIRRAVPYPPRAAMTARASGRERAHRSWAARWASSPARNRSFASSPSAVSGTNPADERRESPRARRSGSTGPAGATTATTSPGRSGGGNLLRIGSPFRQQPGQVRRGEQQGKDQDGERAGVPVRVEDRIGGPPGGGAEVLEIDAVPLVEERFVRPNDSPGERVPVPEEGDRRGEVSRVPLRSHVDVEAVEPEGPPGPPDRDESPLGDRDPRDPVSGEA